uniref:Non-specific serine/threonine protein kinase n=3 Tax=Percolomonas cosmopolitus TaxID=63605 RepID=A0A7S1PDU8_9EUKA|mmetsp:Transcript_10198/g.37913  ORF Transcript_10198/g.37913 Transcript_10198/m.37913 type:complete len:309 (+) Transcript_10198:1111-2037(+)
MKILNKSKLLESDQLEHTKTERAVLQYMSHPFLVNLIYAFQTSDKLYMVMEFVNGGELFFHLKKEKRFAPDRVRFYAAELFLAILHLHTHNIVYRDLKPENILMRPDGHLCLTDFGLSKILSDHFGRTHTFCGTPEYLAPEVLLQKGHGKPVDWWSYGILIYEMLIGIPAFYSENVQEMYDNIIHSDLVFPSFVDATTRDFLSKLLERDPSQRLGTKSPQEIKDHPYFDSIDWEKIYNKEVDPPFIPRIKNETDTSCFEPDFTNQPPTDSLPETADALGESVQKEFEGFTFVDNSRLRDMSGDLHTSA